MWTKTPLAVMSHLQPLEIKFWISEKDLEQGALEQAENLSKLPFAFHHIAIMPDSHQGYGMPIGGVFAAKDAIIPFCVGVDIGCGMCAQRTNLKNIPKDQLRKLSQKIQNRIPTGFNKHKKSIAEIRKPVCQLEIVEQNLKNAELQLGTLGGGNHFIEIQKGDDDYIWIMIHSGSRNLGKKVADHYNKIAKGLNKQWLSSVPSRYDLAFLPLDSEQGQSYKREMDFCVKYAFQNRKVMMEIVKEELQEKITTPINFDNFVNIAHNYAKMENHYGQNVMVHRKGATRARLGEVGIIPGSQGTKSYIVEGLGNRESFHSCSHGAGRKMSRKKAKEKLDLQTEQSKMGDVVHDMRSKDRLDEAPGAYKDINIVMKAQEDLVKIIVELTPLMVIKG